MKTKTTLSRYVIQLAVVSIAGMLFQSLRAADIPASLAIKKSGDGEISILPMLSQPSVKNGQRVIVTAIIEARQGIQRVSADMGGIETLELTPDFRKGGTDATGHRGIYSAEWVGHGLEEKYYTVAIKVIDKSGHSLADRSVQFSDPIAGFNTVGTQGYPQAGMQHIFGTTGYLNAAESTPPTGVINAAGAVVWASNSGGAAAVLIKYAENAPAALPTHQNQSILNAYAQIASSVYDPVTDTALFATNNSPAQIYKVTVGTATGTLGVVGYPITLNSGENNPSTAVWDSTTSTALFGCTNTVVKVGLGAVNSTPVRIGALPIPEAGGDTLTGAIVVNNGEALFGLTSFVGSVFKVTIGAANAAPARVPGVLTFNTGEFGGSGMPSVFEPSQNEAMFVLNTNPTTVVKVNAGAQGALPTRVSAVQFPNVSPPEYGFGPVVYDPSNKVAIVLCGQSEFVKVAIGAAGSAPTRQGVVSTTGIPSGAFYGAGVIDTANSVAMFAGSGAPFSVFKIAVNGPTGNPTLVGGAGAPGISGENGPQSAVFDPNTGYALLGAYSQVSQGGIVIKVAMNGTTSPPVRVGSVLVFGPGGNELRSAVYDPAQQEALFASTSAFIHKIAMNSGPAAPTLVGTISTTSNQDDSYLCSAYSATQKEALFVTNRVPGRVTKVSMNASGVAATLVGSTISLAAGEDNPISIALDDVNKVALIGTQTNPGIVVKVGLGAAGVAPSRLSALPLNSGENSLTSAVFDSVNGVALFSAAGAGVDSIIKVNPNGSGALVPVRVSSIVLNANETNMTAAVYDPINKVALFSNDAGGNSSVVVKIDPGTVAATPLRLGAFTDGPAEIQMHAGVIDPVNGLAYFFSHGGVGDFAPIITVSYTNRFLTYGTKFTMPEQGVVNDVHFFSHVADGNVRLGIVNPPGTILWQSASMPNVAGAEVVATIGSGSPTSLTLTAGTYYLAYITDSLKPVPSYTPGVAGDGFVSSGPQTLALAVSSPFIVTIPTADKYTEYLNYTAISPISITAAANAAPNPANVNQTVAFSVTATGTNPPLSYSWNFGDGSTAATGASVNHAYASAGMFTAKVTITDALNNTSSSQVIVTVNALPPPPMAFTSTPSAVPNPAGVNQSVTFTAAASGGTGALTFSWTFGDASAQATGASVVHPYLTLGTFTAHVTVTDTANKSVGADVVVTVKAPVVGTGNDSDGDGFSDAFENAVGTNPNDASSTPTGQPATAGTLMPLTVTKPKIKLNFAKPGTSDSISFSGTLPVSAGFKPSGAMVSLDVGGVAKMLPLNGKGSNSVKVTIKSKNGIVAAQTAKYAVTFKKGNFAATLASFGLTKVVGPAKTVNVPFTVIFNNTVFQATPALNYTVLMKGKSGTAK